MAFFLIITSVTRSLSLLAFFTATLAAFLSPPALAQSRGNSLSCDDIYKITKKITKLHISHNRFDDELSRRTFNNFIELWDSRKGIFFKKDITELSKKYQNQLDNLIAKKSCGPIAEIVDLFSERFSGFYELSLKHIAMDHDFMVDETMLLDPDSYDYSKTPPERSERHRKWIKYQLMQLMKEHPPQVARQKLTKRYELLKRRFEEKTLSDVYADFIKSYAKSLDPNSSYLSQKESEQMEIELSLSLDGIGVGINSEDGIPKVVSVIVGGAAYRHGILRVGDKILSVAQGEGHHKKKAANPHSEQIEAGEWVSLVDKSLDKVVGYIRGPRGTKVKLLILREGPEGLEKFEVEITRDKINLNDEAVKSYTYDIHSPLSNQVFRVGVAEVPSFYLNQQARAMGAENYRSAARDLRAGIEKLMEQNVSAIIVDLRSNGGGYLDEAVDVSELFLPPDLPVLQTQGKESQTRKIRYTEEEKGGPLYTGPLVALMDIGSASASEIFVGAVKDHRRGVLVGVGGRSYGKGTVQEILPASGRTSRQGRIKVTITRFYTPGGASNQLRGIAADISLPTWTSIQEYGEEYKEYPVPWNEIAAASPLENLGGIKPQILARLVEGFKIRSRQDDDYFSIQQMISSYQQSKKEGLPISLRAPGLQKKNSLGSDASDTSKPGEVSSSDDEVIEKREPKPRTKSPTTAETITRGPALLNDPYLREAVYIAVDYAQLLSGENPQHYYQDLGSSYPISPPATDSSSDNDDTREDQSASDHNPQVSKNSSAAGAISYLDRESSGRSGPLSLQSISGCEALRGPWRYEC